MQLEPIDRISAQSWNQAIAPFDSTMVYHQAAWLTFLEETGRGKAVRFKIIDNGALLGYFVGFVTKKGPFRVFGSPLSASMSEYMGPIVNAGFDVHRFLLSLDVQCRRLRIHHLEIGSPFLDPEVMQEHGYESSTWMTFQIPLMRDEDAMWGNLKSKARNRIRKGIKNRLVVEDSENPSFVDIHFSQLMEVYGRRRITPPFPIEDFRVLFGRLKPRDLVFTLQVKRADTDEVVASGIFPHDGRRVYSLSTASGIRTRNLCPNELLHWTVMTLAGQRGLQEYRIGDNYRIPRSGGKFKNKFNGSYQPVYRFMRNYSVLAKYGRRLFTRLNRVKRKVSGKIPTKASSVRLNINNKQNHRD